VKGETKSYHCTQGSSKLETFTHFDTKVIMCKIFGEYGLETIDVYSQKFALLQILMCFVANLMIFLK
jgi:hypothetical protein